MNDNLVVEYSNDMAHFRAEYIAGV